MSRKSVMSIVLLVMLALVVCLISGCSQNKEPEATAAVTAAVTEAPAEEATEVPTEEATEAFVTEAPAEEATEAPTEAPTPTPEPVLLATVNGEEIWSDNENLQVAMDYYVDLAESYGMDTSSDDVISLLQQYSMEYAQETAVIYQKAAEFGFSATEEDKVQAEATAKAKWIEELDNFALNAGLVTEDASDDDKAAARADAAAQILEYYGYDEAKYVAEVAESEIYTLITNRLKEKIVGDKKVTDEEIKAYYEDLVKDDREAYENDIGTYEFYTQYYGQPSYFMPEGYRGIVHILLPVDEELMNTWNDLSARLEEQASQAEEEATEETPVPDAEPTAEPEATAEPVTQEMVDAAKQAILDSVKDKVAEINSKLEAGTSFDDLIKEYGTDPGMQDDARRASGYAVHTDSILYDPAFQKAAMALEKIGDVSEPVLGQSGVHILQYLRDIPGGAVELTEEMIEEFRGTLQSEMESEMMSTAVEEWINAAEIVYTEAGEAWKLVEEEPEEEPTAEPTDEPTAEPTEAPTEEPTEAPAEEAAAEPEICTYTVYNTTGEKVTELWITDNATGEKSENYAGEGLEDGKSVEIKGINKEGYNVTLSFKTESGYEGAFTTLHFETVPISLIKVDATSGATTISFTAPEQ